VAGGPFGAGTAASALRGSGGAESSPQGMSERASKCWLQPTLKWELLGISGFLMFFVELGI
jgi:hypothetical protein